MAKDFKDILAEQEGYAGKLRKSSEYTGLKGKPNTRVKNSSKYGLYYDSEGKLTAGIGDLITSEKEAEAKKNLDKKQAFKQFVSNIKKHDSVLDKYLKKHNIELDNENQKDALRNMTFQMGDLSSWKNMTKALKEKNWEKAAEEMKDSKWHNKQTPERARQVIDLFEKPVKKKEIKEEVDLLSNIEQPKKQTELAMADIENMSLEELTELEAQLSREIEAETPKDIESMSLEELEAEEARLSNEIASEEEHSALETFAVHAGNSALFSFGDEIAAGAQSVFGDKSYKENLELNRAYLKRLEEANPKSAMAGEVVGGVAGSMALGGAGAAFRLGKMANLGGAAKNVMIGAGEGVIYGLGESEEDKLVDQMQDALEGGGMGAFGGAVGTVVSKAGGKLVRKASKELRFSGETLVDRSMGISNSTLRRQLHDLLKRKGLNKDEFYEFVQGIKLNDGKQVFNGALTPVEVLENVERKKEEFNKALQMFYNERSEKLGQVIDPTKAVEDMKLKLALDNDAVLTGLKNPQLVRSNKDAISAVQRYESMFATPEKITPGEFWQSIKNMEKELMKSKGANHFFDLDVEDQKMLEGARDYLKGKLEAHLSPEEFDAYEQLVKQTNYNLEYGKLVKGAAFVEEKGITAKIMRSLANSNLVPVLGGMAAGGGISDPLTSMSGVILGYTLQAAAKNPGLNNKLGTAMKNVGNMMISGQATEESLKRIVNASTRSLMDFEQELVHEDIRLQGGLPTVEEQEAEVEKIKASGFGVRDTVKFINQARSGVKPNYEQEVSAPFIKQTQPTGRTPDGRKKSLDERDDDVLGPTQIRSIMPR